MLKQIMTVTALKETIHNRTPADIITSDGGVVHVPHTDYMLVPPTGGIAVIISEAGGVSIVDVANISRVEYAPGGADPD